MRPAERVRFSRVPLDVTRMAQLEENLALLSTPIPVAFWVDLRASGLLHRRAGSIVRHVRA